MGFSLAYIGPNEGDIAEVPVGVVVGTLTTYDGKHAALAGVAIDFRFVDTTTEGQSHPGRVWTVYSGAAGALSVNLKPSTDYQARREQGDWVDFTTPAEGSFSLPGILGGE